MAKRSYSPGFLAEAPDVAWIRRQRGRQDLHRHRAVQPFFVRAIHLGHAADAKQRL